MIYLAMGMFFILGLMCFCELEKQRKFEIKYAKLKDRTVRAVLALYEVRGR